MKQPLFTLILLFLATALTAQEFDIRSFAAVPNDLSARKEVRRTVNDEPCALIKVVTNIEGMQFESNIGIVDVEHQADGYWLFVAPRERRIKLMASGYLSRDVAMPEPAKELMVYKLVVAATGTGAREQNSQLISVTFRLNEDNVFIRSGGNAPVAASGRSAVFFVPEGLHNFTFSKSGFEEESLEIDVRETTVRDVVMRPGEGSASMSLSGFVVITSEPAGAEVFLNDQRVGTTPYQGRHVPGDYSLALRSYQYYDHSESFTLDQGATYQLPQIALKPQFGFVSIRTTPTDAEVLINDKPVGTAPVSRRQLGSGYHSIKVRKSLYHESSESFTLEDGEEKSLEIVLKPAFGSLKITSEPAGAEVYIDESRAGTTPYVNEKQPSGTYNVRVEEELYAPARYAVTVSDGEESEKFFALTANFGTLKVASPGAEIFIDGKSAGRDRISKQLAPGNYKVEARRDKHDTDTKDVFVMVGNSETVTLEPRPRMGAVSIMTEPFEASGAEIWIDGKKTGLKTPAVFELLEGTYSLRLVKPSFKDKTISISIEPGKEISRSISMGDKHLTSKPIQNSNKKEARSKYKGMNGVMLSVGSPLMFGTGFIKLPTKGLGFYLTMDYNFQQNRNTPSGILRLDGSYEIESGTVIKPEEIDSVEPRSQVLTLASGMTIAIYSFLSVNIGLRGVVWGEFDIVKLKSGETLNMNYAERHNKLSLLPDIGISARVSKAIGINYTFNPTFGIFKEVDPEDAQRGESFEGLPKGLARNRISLIIKIK